MFPLATDPSQKIKLLKIRVKNAPNFCQIGCDSPFERKKEKKNMENVSKLGSF